jgi:uncharacterized phage protein (TIGR01671 family)
MNREIKFRAWYGGKMLHNVAVIGGIAMREENPKGDCVVRGEDGKVGYTDWATYQPLQGAILMQFTGLLDKNGVEIYEGDIIRHIKLHEEEPVIYLPHLSRFAINELGEWWYGPEWLQVIGNIHDNAELLEQK